jgi:hypothetical protein
MESATFKPNAIETVWKGYAKMCVPGPEGTVQYAETRQAFFAGAAALFEMHNRIAAGPNDEPTDSEIAEMSKLADELAEFGRQLDGSILSKPGHG